MIETLNGVQLYFEIHGSGDPLLLLHGFSGCSQDWLPLIAEWSAHFQLVIPDLRGHGRSSNPSKHSVMTKPPPTRSPCSIAWGSAPSRDSE